MSLVKDKAIGQVNANLISLVDFQKSKRFDACWFLRLNVT